MKKQKQIEVWTAAYAVAFGITTLMSEIRGVRPDASIIDARARELADRFTKTALEKMAEADGQD